MKPFRLTPIAAALTMAVAQPAHPQSAEAANGATPNSVALGPATQLEGVEVTGTDRLTDVKTDTTTLGKIQTPLRDVPQTVTIINREMLNAQGATSLSDAL